MLLLSVDIFNADDGVMIVVVDGSRSALVVVKWQWFMSRRKSRQ